MQPAQPTAPPPPPTIGYAPREEPRLRVVDYLLQCLTAAVFVGLIVGSMAVVGKFKQIFIDFGLKLPRVTQLLLDVAQLYHSCYLWLILWIIPPLVPLLLVRARPTTRRWLLLLAVLLGAALIFTLFLAIFLPMITLVEGITNKPAGR